MAKRDKGRREAGIKVQNEVVRIELAERMRKLANSKASYAEQLDTLLKPVSEKNSAAKVNVVDNKGVISIPKAAHPEKFANFVADLKAKVKVQNETMRIELQDRMNKLKTSEASHEEQLKTLLKPFSEKNSGFKVNLVDKKGTVVIPKAAHPEGLKEFIAQLKEKIATTAAEKPAVAPAMKGTVKTAEKPATSPAMKGTVKAAEKPATPPAMKGVVKTPAKATKERGMQGVSGEMLEHKKAIDAAFMKLKKEMDDPKHKNDRVNNEAQMLFADLERHKEAYFKNPNKTSGERFFNLCNGALQGKKAVLQQDMSMWSSLTNFIKTLKNIVLIGGLKIWKGISTVSKGTYKDSFFQSKKTEKSDLVKASDKMMEDLGKAFEKKSGPK